MQAVRTHSRAIVPLAAVAAALIVAAAAPSPAAEPAASTSDLEGIYKVGVRVSDLERSIRFYRDVLGMELTQQTEFTGADAHDVLRIPAAARGSFRTAVVRGRGAYIEMFQFSLKEPVRPYQWNSMADIGGTFFLSFYVDDIWKTYNEMKAKGVEFVTPPQEMKVRGNVARLCFFKDPDGMPLELVERRATNR
jgi:catechol 2,3-dioxygenase-like lactoylglutathione lyase family enzyme